MDASSVPLVALLHPDGDVAQPLHDRVGTATVLWLESLDGRGRIDSALGDDELADVGVGLLGVVDGGEERPLDINRGTLRGEGEHVEGGVHVLAADEVHDEPDLAAAPAM